MASSSIMNEKPQQSIPSSPPSNSSNKALADALTGVAASLLSLWVFYPFDVWITNVQAATTATTTVSSTPAVSGNNNKNNVKDNNKRVLRHQSSSLFDQMPSSVTEMLAGWKLKTLHTASSSFCYFFLYSWLFTTYNKRRRRTLQKTNQDEFKTSTRLLLTSIAAMMNTLLTLPLDVISSQQQTITPPTTNNNSNKATATVKSIGESLSKSNSETNSTERKIYLIVEDDEDDDDTANNNKQKRNSIQSEISFVFQQDAVIDDEKSDDRSSDVLVQNDDECGSDDNNDNKTAEDVSIEYFPDETDGDNQRMIPDNEGLRYYPKESIGRNTRFSHNTSGINGYFQRFRSLWKGLVPSLILSSNPAINYTVFESCKMQLLLYKKQRQQHHNTIQNNNNLNMLEAFLIGLLAKFVATIATYPLIKAKVMLMVQNDGSMNSKNRKRSQTPSSSSSLISLLWHEYQKGGIATGLYRGCSLQLFHTILKSALLMMFRERITQTAYRLLAAPAKK